MSEAYGRTGSQVEAPPARHSRDALYHNVGAEGKAPSPAAFMYGATAAVLEFVSRVSACFLPTIECRNSNATMSFPGSWFWCLSQRLHMPAEKRYAGRLQASAGSRARWFEGFIIRSARLAPRYMASCGAAARKACRRRSQAQTQRANVVTR